MKQILSIILTALFFVGLPLSAQELDTEQRQVYAQAESLYQIGHLEEVIQLLEQHAQAFRGTMRQSVFRLLALTYLAMDDEEAAEKNAMQLLRENPYYTPVQDPPRFSDIIDKLKEGRNATVTTASSQEESLSEVPVPTTLITAEMIRACGGRNLQEVLAAYVPGMNIVDCNDDINIAMRGIYSNGQEKILIMLNGHRLNSYSTNVAAPDFSISLDKIKQIEVLRGPASSLYGGVALTAVVNLITKDGGEVDGIRLKGGAGNYGQLRGDVLLGKRLYDIDLLVWGSIYRAKGEKRYVSDDERLLDIYANNKDVNIGGIGNVPSHDLGFQLNWSGLRLLYNSRFSQVESPYTMATLAKPYDYNAYMTFNDLSPGFANKAHYIDASYSRQLGPLHVRGSASYDQGDITQYQVISDAELPDLNSYFGFGDDGIFFNPGLFRYINLREQTLSTKLNADYSYVNTSDHKGSLAFGIEYSHFRLSDARYELGSNFNQAHSALQYHHTTVQDHFKGHENTNNAYVQLKHRWKSLILNAGMRYDYKKRTDHYHLRELSPRLALIMLRPKWNVKLSFSKAFVDAPYYYRRANPFIVIMSTRLEEEELSVDRLWPESLHSLQLTFAGTEWTEGLNFEVNAFYNHAKNMITTAILDYQNEVSNKTMGVELMANYRRPKFTVDFNLSWTHTLKANLANVEIDANNNLPAIMSHAVLTWKPYRRFRLFSHLAFSGKQTTYSYDIVQMISASMYYELAFDFYKEGLTQEADEWVELAKDAYERRIYKADMEANLLCDVGTEYRLGKFTIGLNVNNLFNTHYFRSGMNTKVVPQRGRWFMFSLGYSL